MPQSRRRRDNYGRPLPTLAPVSAPTTDLVEAPRNVELRQYVQALLTQYYGELLTAGCFADVVLHVRVQDGTLARDVDVSVTRHYRFTREE